MDQEELDYDGEEEYGEKKNMAISALAEEEMMPEDDEYEDLYNDVNVGEGFMESVDNNNNNNNNTNATDVDTNPVAPPPEQNEAEAEAEAEADSTEVNKGLKIEDLKDGEEVVGEKEGFSGVKEELGFDASEGQNPNPVNPRVSEKNGDFVASRPVAAKPTTPEVSKPVEPRAPNRVNNNNQNRGGGGSINENSSRTNEGGGATMLFVGDLHWWTTDAEIEAELNKYGRVKELKFYDEKASGKSKGYCHVEFYDPSAAAACKQGMHNHSFNGRNCVVEFANANGVRQMGAAQVSKQQLQVNQGQSQQRRTGNEGGGGGGGGNRGMGNYQGGSGDSGRNYNKMGNWGRSGQGGGGNRGQGGQGRGRGMGGKNMGGGGSGGGPYGQGLPGPPMGAPPGGLMHPQGLMGQGFDPAYGAHMGRGGGYGGFSSHGPFPGMMPPFPPVGTVGLPGVAPHVNPAFFGRGVAANGMAMMPSGGMDGQMWGDSSMGGGGWNNEEQHGRRMRESSYGDDMSSDYGYNDMGHDRAGRSSGTRDKDRGGSERDWGGSSDRRRRDDRDGDWHRDRYRDDKEGYSDRQRDRDWDNEEDWDREKPSKGRSKSRMMDDDDQRPRSKDVEYNKRRRMPSDHE